MHAMTYLVSGLEVSIILDSCVDETATEAILAICDRVNDSIDTSNEVADMLSDLGVQ